MDEEAEFRAVGVNLEFSAHSPRRDGCLIRAPGCIDWAHSVWRTVDFGDQTWVILKQFGLFAISRFIFVWFFSLCSPLLHSKSESWAAIQSAGSLCLFRDTWELFPLCQGNWDNSGDSASPLTHVSMQVVSLMKLHVGRRIVHSYIGSHYFLIHPKPKTLCAWKAECWHVVRSHVCASSLELESAGC